MFSLFRKKNGPSPLIQQAIDALADPEADDLSCAIAVGKAFEVVGVEVEPQLWDYIERFPDSYHLMRVFAAALLADRGDFDEATEQARIYLRLVRDGLAKMAELPTTQEGATRAFLLVTAAYTEAGARSYSKRVLELALTFPLRRKDHIEGELRRLDKELSRRDLAELDARWEALFADGEGARALWELCDAKKLPSLAERVELIEEQHKFGYPARVNEVQTELFRIASDIRLSDGTTARGLA